MGVFASCQQASPVLLQLGEQLLEPAAVKLVKFALMELKQKYPSEYTMLVEGVHKGRKIADIVMSPETIAVLKAFGLVDKTGKPTNAYLEDAVKLYTKIDNVAETADVINTKTATASGKVKRIPKQLPS